MSDLRGAEAVAAFYGVDERTIRRGPESWESRFAMGSW